MIEPEIVCELCGGHFDELHGTEIETAPGTTERITVCDWCDPPEHP